MRPVEAQPGAPSSLAPQSKRRLLLVADDSSAPIFLRIVAELEAQGFAVVRVVSEPEAFEIRELEPMARGVQAVALVELAVRTDEIRIRILDLVRGRNARQRLPTDEGLAVTSLRIAEILRLHLGDLLRGPALPPLPAATRAAPEPSLGDAERAKARDPAGSALYLGLGPARSVAWRATSWQGALGWRWPLSAGHGLEASASFPVVAGSVPASGGGRARIEPWAVGLAWDWSPLGSHAGIVDGSLGLGVWAMRLDAIGEPAPSQTSERHTRFSAAPFLQLRGRALIASQFRLRADLRATSVWPRFSVRGADSRIGRWGALVGIASLGVEAWLP